MQPVRRTILSGVLAIAWILALVPLPALQERAAEAGAGLTPEQVEEFLLKAKIVRMKSTGKGVTGTSRATLSNGRLTHDAHVQMIDESKTNFRGSRGTELNFKDSYRYNIAGYRLARLLGLDNVPPSVVRHIGGRPAAVTWWVDDVLMDEGERVKQRASGNEPARTARQMHLMRVFDELIYNTDRNQGNLLWTTDWKMWMIDHTRAFRTLKDLRNAKHLQRCERSLLEKMRQLTAETLRHTLGDSATPAETDALLARRDEIVKLFEGMIAARGEAAILYSLQQP